MNIGFNLDPDTLTTHGVVLGRTGSGKTGLITRIVEQLPAYTAAIVYDIKHDLSNIAVDQTHWNVHHQVSVQPQAGSILDAIKAKPNLRAFLEHVPPTRWLARLKDPPSVLGIIYKDFRGIPLETFISHREREKAIVALLSLPRQPSAPPLDITGRSIIRSEPTGDQLQTIVDALGTPLLPASTRLRLLVVIDECRNLIPGNGNPATKQPLATLLSRGRAFGVGVLLGTQHPMDICYRSLSNVGTWFIGALRGRDLHRDLRHECNAYVIESLAPRQFYVPRYKEVLNVSTCNTNLRGPIAWPQAT